MKMGHAQPFARADTTSSRSMPQPQRVQHDLSDRVVALLTRLFAPVPPSGLSADDEDAVYETLLRAVERAEAAAK